MKAIVWNGMLNLVDDYPRPVPKDGEALIRVTMAGICNTDLEITKGYMGFRGVLGHEFVGVVEGASRDCGWTGKRVVGDINCSCGVCSYCTAGMRTHCPSRTTLGIAGRDGAFAEYVALPESNLFEVPDAVSDEEAVFTEPLAAAFEVAQQIHVRPTDRVVVIGDGKLGLLCALALRLTGADVKLVGKHEKKMEIARAQHIETVHLDRMAMKKSYDVVVEATGRADGLETAMDLVRPRGTIVLKSTVAERKEMCLTPVVVDEITVSGSRCGPFAPAIRAISEGLVDVKPLISAIIPFQEGMDAFEKSKENEIIKILMDFS